MNRITMLKTVGFLSVCLANTGAFAATRSLPYYGEPNQLQAQQEQWNEDAQPEVSVQEAQDSSEEALDIPASNAPVARKSKTKNQLMLLQNKTESDVIQRIDEDRLREEVGRSNKFLKALDQTNAIGIGNAPQNAQEASMDEDSDEEVSYDQPVVTTTTKRKGKKKRKIIIEEDSDDAGVNVDQEVKIVNASPTVSGKNNSVGASGIGGAADSAQTSTVNAEKVYYNRAKISGALGYTGFESDYFDVNTNYSWGVNAGYNVNEFMEMGLSYHYQLFDLVPTTRTYSGFSPTRTDYTLEQHIVGVDGKFHLLGAYSQFRPYLGGGLNYIRSLVEFDDTYRYRYNYRETTMNSFGGSLLGGAELQLAKSLMLGVQGRYQYIFSSDSSTSDNGAYYFWRSNRNVDVRKEETLGEESFYQVLGTVGFAF